MTTRQRVEILRAVGLLAAAFRQRDLQAALACFMPDDDIGYLGSEPAECADGRAAVAALLADLFARPEAYSWDVQAASIFTADGIAYLSCEAIGRVHTDDRAAQSFPYRLSGLLQHTPSGWRWRACHGCEPTAPTAHHDQTSRT